MATPGTLEELREIYSDIRRVFELHPFKTQIVHRLALEVRANIESIDPLIEEMTAEVCPQCESPKCTNLNGRFDRRDIIYLAALEMRLPPFQDGLEDDAACQFLTAKGCGLPRTMRPHRCNWWYCEPLLKFIGSWEPKKQRMFIYLMERITQTRKQMCDEFKKIQEILRVAD